MANGPKSMTIEEHISNTLLALSASLYCQSNVSPRQLRITNAERVVFTMSYYIMLKTNHVIHVHCFEVSALFQCAKIGVWGDGKSAVEDGLH